MKKRYYYRGTFADKEVRFAFLYENTYRYFKDFLIQTEPGCSDIEIDEDEIKTWGKKWNMDDETFTEYNLSLYHVCEYLLNYDMCLFHCAAIIFNGKALIFTAPSGTGKTTQIKNWCHLYPEEVIILNGDKPILDFSHDQIIVHSSPWKGKEGWGCDGYSAPLSAVIYLAQGKENKLDRLSVKQAVVPLLKRFLFRVEHEEDVLKVCQLEEKLLKSIPVYKLTNTGDERSSMMTHDRLLEDVIRNEV